MEGAREHGLSLAGQIEAVLFVAERPVSVTELARLLGAPPDAIEVLSSSHTVEQFTEFARHARVFGLLASSGSDYHGPGESWVDLGGMPPLPAGVTPVWQNW